MTIGLSLLVPFVGQWISWEVEVRYKTPLGISGTVVLVSVAVFTLSMLVGPWVRSRKTA
jgi:hypothetical protein